MPTRPKKGSTPHENASGRTSRGGQKAVTGSARSPEVAEAAKEAITDGGAEADGEQTSPGNG
jgi:hypothetical protein